MALKITLKAARANCGMTLKDVSEKTGKSIDTISKYEMDSTSIPHDLTIALLELYQFPFTNIFFGKESEFHGLRFKNNMRNGIDANSA